MEIRHQSPEQVKELGEAYDWRVTKHDTSQGMIILRRGRQEIHVWPRTGTVGIYLSVEQKPITQSFYRRASMEMLEDIFAKPYLFEKK